MPPLSHSSPSPPATNAASNALQVICAWPVSGQYGPGSRVLYYVLIAACVFARKAKWLRNACLAAALLFPAVAALHGIVLAAVHVNGAVDMDVYGAFQLCSMGILAAPVTVKLSRTYFDDPGRNTIFLWTGLILAGLLSLTVEFYRINPSDCTHDDSGNPISPDATKFPHKNATCGLTCSVEQGPYSPLRGGSANNIYIIPAPAKLTFGTATLLAAACCIPAILSLISMWDKILEINWKMRFGDRDADERIDEPIEGTNGATIRKMRGVNNMIKLFLSVVEIPVLGGAVLAILIIGERNFFSSQVRYQTEPIASIGQWAPIVGTGLAALGSLYLLLAADVEAVKEEAKPNASMHHCNCSHDHHGGERHPTLHVQPGVDAQSIDGDVSQPQTADAGYRHKVAEVLAAIANSFGTAAHDWSDVFEFKHGPALDFPEIPGEEERNSALPQIREQYNQRREADGSEQRSRMGSFPSSVASSLGVEGGSAMRRAASSPSPSPTTPRGSHASTLPAGRTSVELQKTASSSSAASTGGRPRQRRDTLEVPSPVHYSPRRNSTSASSITSIVTIPGGQSPPAIVASSDLETYSPAHTPVVQSPAPPLSFEQLPPIRIAASPSLS